MISDDNIKKGKMALVYRTLESALQSLQEAHRICYEELHPTWQTVDQDIDVVKGSLQTIIKDLAQRDIGDIDTKTPIVLGPAPPPEDDFPPECPWCGSYRTKKHEPGTSATKSQALVYICGGCENTFSESRE